MYIRKVWNYLYRVSINIRDDILRSEVNRRTHIVPVYTNNSDDLTYLIEKSNTIVRKKF